MVKEVETHTAMLPTHTTRDGCALRKNEEEAIATPRHSDSREMARSWGETHAAHAQVREANLHGGFLEFLDEEKYPIERTQAELMNLVSGHTAKARVSAIRRSATGALLGVAVELLRPTKSFGADLSVRRTTGELLKLEHGIKSGDIDPYVLRDFRDAWITFARPRGRSGMAGETGSEAGYGNGNSLLVTERIRRGTQLYAALTADLKSHAIRPEAAEIEDLLHAVEHLYEELKQLN